MDLSLNVVTSSNKIFHDVNAIIYLYNLDENRFIWNNDTYRDIFGFDNIGSLSLQDVFENNVHYDDRIIFNNLFDNLNTEKGNLRRGVYRVKHNQGHYIRLYSKVQLIAQKPSLLLGISIEVKKDILLAEQLVNNTGNHLRNALFISAINTISDREFEVVKLIASGKTYKEIASTLSIQPDTVNKHRKHIFEKLDVHNSAALIALCFKEGLFQ